MNNLNRQLLFASKQNYHIYIGERYTGKVDAHYHSFYHCTLLLKGDLAYFQQDQMLRMQPGDLLFTPIYCNHSLFAGNLLFLFFLFPGDDGCAGILLSKAEKGFFQPAAHHPYAAA